MEKTAYEWLVSDWSSDVCSSDLALYRVQRLPFTSSQHDSVRSAIEMWAADPTFHRVVFVTTDGLCIRSSLEPVERLASASAFDERPEEHTSELQSLMRTSYAVF